MSRWVFGTAIRMIDGDYVVSVRDLPEVVTSGDSDAQALALALDAIEVSIGFRMEKGEPLPTVTPVQDGENAVGLSALSSAKASIYEAWRGSGMSKSELGRRMGHAESDVRRMLALGRSTKLDRLEEAAKALGMRLEVGLVPIRVKPGKMESP